MNVSSATPDGHNEPQKEGDTPSSSPVTQARRSSAGPNKLTEEEALKRLREHVETQGGALEDGWTCEVRYRLQDSRHRPDVYFTPPGGGRKLRSFIEVLKHQGIAKSPTWKTANMSTGKSSVPSTKGAARKGAARKAAAAEGSRPAVAKETRAQAKSGEPLAGASMGGAAPEKDAVYGRTASSENTMDPADKVAPKKAASSRAVSREEAIKNAREAHERLRLPFRAGETTVVRLGNFDSRPSYRSRLHIFPVGYNAELPVPGGSTFIFEISDGGESGPALSVSLKREGQHVQVLASEDTANKALAKATELLKDHPEVEAKQDDGETGTHFHTALGEDLSGKPISGLHRFGLGSMQVMRAVEGLEGVADCPDYKYVEEQRGWKSHMSLVRKLSNSDLSTPQVVSKQQAGTALEKGSGSETAKPIGFQTKINGVLTPRPAQPSTGEKRAHDLGDDPRPAKRQAAGSSNTSKNAKMNLNSALAVANVMAKLLDNVEKREAQERRKAEKAEKDAKVKREKEAAAAAERRRKAMEMEAHQKAATAINVEDSLLPRHTEQPPPPQIVPGSYGFPEDALPGVLELWELIGRFGGMLSEAECPNIQQLLDALLNPPADGNDAFNRSMAAITEAVLDESFQSALEVASVANEDFKAREHASAAPSVQVTTWPEIARRLFTLAHIGTLVHGSQDSVMSGGLDVALGDYVGSSPLAHLGPGIVCQGLLAASLPANPACSAAALPVGACPSSAAVRNARLDAQALRALEHHLATSGDSSNPILSSKVIVTCQNLLQYIAAVKGSKDTEGLLSRAKILFFEGERAALAAKWARPLDLNTISVRNDLGLYASMPNGVETFAADVRYVCNLFQAAARSKKSEFSHTLQSKRAPEILEKVREVLTAKVPDALAGTLEPPSNNKKMARSAPPSREPSVDADNEKPTQAAADDDADLSVPLNLGSGCCICWKDEDQSKILICDGCEDEYHTYCLVPPLAELPSEDWFCPPCEAERHGKAAPPLYQQDPCQGQHVKEDTYSRMAAALGSKEFNELAITQRVAVAELVASLFECSTFVREHLDNNEAEKKHLQKEVRDLKAKIKRDGKEREEKEKEERELLKKKAVGKPEAREPRPRTRAEEAAEMEAIQDRSRLEALIKQLQTQDGGVRGEPIGYDRHWNRYWIFGGPDDGLLCVEITSGKLSDEEGMHQLSTRPAPASPLQNSKSQNLEWGCYPDTASLDGLIRFLNFQGAREGPLLKAVKKHRERLQQPPPKPFRISASQEAPSAEEPPGGQTELANGSDDYEAAGEELKGSTDLEDRCGKKAETSGMSELRAELLALVDNLEVDSLDKTRATARRLELWRSLADSATSTQELMAALLLAESFLSVDRLKHWWRLWAFPCPLFTENGTLAAVSVRLRALKLAMKKGPLYRPLYGAATDSGDAKMGRYTLRAKRAAAGSLAESPFRARHESEDEYVDDEALARRLQASEGAQRATRASLKMPSRLPESNGVRSTRAASKLQESSGPAVASLQAPAKTKRALAAQILEDTATEESSKASSACDDSKVHPMSTPQEAEEVESEAASPGSSKYVKVEGRKRLRKAIT